MYQGRKLTQGIQCLCLFVSMERLVSGDLNCVKLIPTKKVYTGFFSCKLNERVKKIF